MNPTDATRRGPGLRQLLSLLSSLTIISAGCARFDSSSQPGPDGQEECRQHTDCLEANAPICGPDGQCRGCEASAECVDRDEDFPTCMGGACLATCTDNQDCSDPTRPYCGDGDTCVECLDSSHCGNQICDQSAGLCTACTEHFQCGSGACDQASGDCVAAADIIYVDKNHDMADDLGDCNDAMPCATIGGAINRIKMALDARDTIVVRGDATVVYDEPLVVDGITATLIGSGARIRPALDNPGVLVTNGADVTVEGFTITGAVGNQSADGIHCAANDFHLQPDSPGVDVDGLASDLAVDFDGDTRPQNGLFDMGADEVVTP